MNKSSRGSNSVRNFTVGGFNQVILLALNLVAKSIFIKSLGTVFMGLNGLFTNIFLLLSFAEFGIGSVMIYSLYLPISQNDKEGVASIYRFFRKIYLQLNGLILIAGMLVIPFLTSMVNVETPISNLRGYYILYLIGIIISNIFVYNSNMIMADQKRYILSLYELLFEGIAIVFQVVFLIITKNYAIYLMIFIVKNILFALATSYKTKKLYPFLRDKEINKEVGKEKKKVIYNKIRDVFGYKFARTFITGTDNIMISTLVGTIWVGYYSNYDLIIVGVMSLISTFYSGIEASVGNFIAKKDKDSQFSMFQTVQVINMWIVGFTTTCLFVLFQDFITLWLGIEYLLDFKIVILIIINYYLLCSRKSISLFREAAGLFDKIKYAMFVGAGLNIILSLVLGRVIGIYGVLLGTTISALASYYWYEAKILIKDQFSKSFKIFFKNQSETLIYTCLSIAITSLAVSRIKELTIATFTLKMFICLIVSNLFYVLVLFRKKEFKEIIKTEVGGLWRKSQ